MSRLAFGILSCRNASKKVVCENIGLHPSSRLLELQTPTKGLLVKFPIEISKVIAIHLLYSCMTRREGLHVHGN